MCFQNDNFLIQNTTEIPTVFSQAFELIHETFKPKLPNILGPNSPDNDYFDDSDSDDEEVNRINRKIK